MCLNKFHSPRGVRARSTVLIIIMIIMNSPIEAGQHRTTGSRIMKQTDECTYKLRRILLSCWKKARLRGQLKRRGIQKLESWALNQRCASASAASAGRRRRNLRSFAGQHDALLSLSLFGSFVLCVFNFRSFRVIPELPNANEYKHSCSVHCFCSRQSTWCHLCTEARNLPAASTVI